MPPRIYFDNAATTPLDPRVREAMRPYLERALGQSVEPASAKGGRPARPSRRRQSAGGRRCSAPSRARSSSPAAAPRPTTWRSAGVVLAAGDRPVPRRSPVRSSIRPCWNVADGLERLGVE